MNYLGTMVIVWNAITKIENIDAVIIGLMIELVVFCSCKAV